MQLNYAKNRIKRILLEFSDKSSQLIGPLLANDNRKHDFEWELFPLKPVNTRMVKIMAKEMQQKDAPFSGFRELRFMGEPEELTTQSDKVVTTQTEKMEKNRDHLKGILKKRRRMRKKKIRTIVRKSVGSREKDMGGLQMSFLVTLVAFNLP